jgi:hypothetical protein
MLPLLALSSLQAISACCFTQRLPPLEAAELAKLGSLPGLQRVTFRWADRHAGGCPADAVAAWAELLMKQHDLLGPAFQCFPPAVVQVLRAWGGLQLQHLKLLGPSFPAAVVQALSSLQGLTSLQLCHSSGGSTQLPGVRGARLYSTVAELAAALAPLSALRCLQLCELMSASCGLDGGDDLEGTAALLRALGGMPDLSSVEVLLHIKLQEAPAAAAVQQLSAVAAQLPSSLASSCEVTQQRLRFVKV